jgi:O-antigen/teichoic acid export membrane protein
MILRILGLVLIIFVIRILGVVEYGKFSFALSFVSLMSILAGLGVVDIATREFSQVKENEKRFVGIFTLQAILCALALAIIIVSSFFITSDGNIRKMIWILAVFILSSSLFGTLFSFLRARQKMEYEAFAKIFQSILNVSAVFLVILYIPSAENMSYAYMLSNLVVVAVVFLLFSNFFHRLSLKWEKESLNILKMSWPLSLGFSSEWILILINSVVLGIFNLNAANGWYGAASKIAIAAIMPADLVIRSFYPALSNFFITSKETFQKAWDHLAEIMIFLAIPTVVGGVVMADKVINFLYGSNFAPSILALQMLVFVIGISFVSYPYAIVLVVANHQKNNFIFMMLGAAINIILDFILIPRYGIYGALASTIIASFVVFILMVALFIKKIPILPFNVRLLKAILISALSSFIMYFLISCPLIYRLNVIIVCLLGAVAYGISLLVLYKFIFLSKTGHKS